MFGVNVKTLRTIKYSVSGIGGSSGGGIAVVVVALARRR